MMKNIKYKLLLFSLILLMVTCCEPFMEKWYYINVTNLSPKALMVTAGYGRFLMNAYPDTILPSTEPSLQKVEPNKHIDLTSSFKWENVIQDMPLDTLSIYFFDADTLETYSWIQVKKENKVLKRFDLSVQDLKDKNWKIHYP